MRLSYLVFRVKRYAKERGLFSALVHVLEYARRWVQNNTYVVFCCELARLGTRNSVDLGGFLIRRKDATSNLTEYETSTFVEHLGRAFYQSSWEGRFNRGAQLWILEKDQSILGYVWSVRRQPLSPYFFPLHEDDVHLFDNYVFAEFRGKSLNAILLETVLRRLRDAGCSRGYIETRVWNNSELRSLGKSFFEPMAVMKKFRLSKWHFLLWKKYER